MAIVFITDSSVSRRGFKATYRSLTKQGMYQLINDLRFQSVYGVCQEIVTHLCGCRGGALRSAVLLLIQLYM